MAKLIQTALDLVANAPGVAWCALVTGDAPPSWTIAASAGRGAPAAGTPWPPSGAQVPSGKTPGARLQPLPLDDGSGGRAAVILQPTGPAAAPEGLLAALALHLKGLLRRPAGETGAGGTEPATGLLPATEAWQRLAAEVARTQRHGGNVSVLLGELPMLTAAREAGDESASERILLAAGAALRAYLRQMDFAGCFAGAGRVLIVLPETGAEEDRKIAPCT